MRKSRAIAAIAAALFAAPLWLISQETSQPVIRVTVDLVQVDATVIDSKGHRVTGLKPEDFEIREDGKLQRISHFSCIEGRLPPGQIAKTQQPEPFVPARPLSREQVQRTLVMIADDLGLAASDIVDVRKAMKRFVDTEMRSGDLVSIMTTSGGMGALEQLTNDKRQLYASIDRIHWFPGRSGVTWYQPVRVTPDAASRVEDAIGRRIGSTRNHFYKAGSLSSVAFAIDGLRSLPGRKAVALFSDGFSDDPDLLVELANRASVVIYTFDPRGIASFFLSAVDLCKGCNVRAQENAREVGYRSSQKGLALLARGTGGTFFHDDNGLFEGLTEALDDMGSYYLLGYQPNRSSFNRVGGHAQFHKLSIRVLKEGLTVRSRNGFTGAPDEPDAAPRDELRQALFSPFQASGIPVYLSAFYSAVPGKKGSRQTVLHAMLAIDPHRIEFTEGAGGRRELKVDAVAAVYGTNNKLIQSSNQTFTGGVEASEFDSTMASGLLWGMDLSIADPGPYQLRVVLRDTASRRIGSATAFVEVPDFKKPSLSLTSLLLSDSDAKRIDELTHAGVIGAGSPVTRVFGPGAVIAYDCAVFGSAASPTMQIRLFNGPEQIYSGAAIPLTDSHRAAGQITLPATLPAARYALQLTVSDGKQTAAQWADFRIVR